MTNADVRAGAAAGGATVRTFAQGEGICDGFVSWWIRNQVQKKAFFSSKRFTAVTTPEGPRFITASHHADDGTLSVDKGLTKARALQSLVYGNPTATRDYITKGLRADKPTKKAKEIIDEFDNLKLSPIRSSPAADTDLLAQLETRIARKRLLAGI
jgi:hypothetical protein